MSNRDEFPKKIKTAVAMRAGWRCSFTGCESPTVGPSEESTEAAAMIGKAAHICGAASGQGSRRYDATMTPEERASIDNAIWLCANHADLIDRDEVTYSVEMLRAMKREHEVSCAKAMCSGATQDLSAGLLAIGPDIVCTGDIQRISVDSWALRLKHFVVGDMHKVVSYIDRFAKTAIEDRYVISNELGDGRGLSGPPNLTKQSDCYLLHCPVAPGVPRIDVQRLGSSFAVHPETGDMYLDNKGSIARVSGLEYLPQMIQSSLSMQRGESVLHPTVGIRFFEYFETFSGSPWLELLLMLDVVRQAAIPFADAQHTPLRCVTRIHSFKLLSDNSTNNRLPIRVDFEVQGIGRWQQDLSIYMPTKEQVTSRSMRQD